MVNTVILSLGSNVGDREMNLKKAVSRLEKDFDAKLRKSPVYETPPLYFEEQDDFYNCCVSFKSEMSPIKVFRKTSALEDRMGRERMMRHGPRIIDIDIIFIGDQIVAEEELTVPHPALQDRLFVLKPLFDIHPDFFHPAMQMSVSEMLEECPDESDIIKVKNFWK